MKCFWLLSLTFSLSVGRLFTLQFHGIICIVSLLVTEEIFAYSYGKKEKYINHTHKIRIPLFPTIIPAWDQYNIFSSCCDKDSAIIFNEGRLPDVNPP
jgi:hypothetical protein